MFNMSRIPDLLEEQGGGKRKKKRKKKKKLNNHNIRSDGNLLLPSLLHTKSLQMLPGQWQPKQAVKHLQLQACMPIRNSLLEGKVHGFRQDPDEVRILWHDQGKPGVKRKVSMRRRKGLSCLPAREGESILLTSCWSYLHCCLQRLQGTHIS